MPTTHLGIGQSSEETAPAPEVEMSDVQALLQSGDARIVDGPSSVGAFAVDVPADAGAAWLERLRSDARVRLAEPAVAGAAQ